MKDLYAILGLDPRASAEEVRGAYRALAKRCHPDLAGPEGLRAFQELQAAYEVLGDPARRRRYDRAHGLAAGEHPASPAGTPVDSQRARGPAVQPLPTVGSNPPWAAQAPDWPHALEALLRRGLARRQAPRYALPLELILTPQEAAAGLRLHLELPLAVRCEACGGRGTLLGAFACERCGGQGLRPSPRRIEIGLPAGLTDRTLLELPLDDPELPGLLVRMLVRVE